MELKGKSVMHVKFGKGKIVVVEGNVLEAEMESGEVKRFLYPDSFVMGILRFEEENLNEKGAADFEESERKKREDEERRSAEIEKKREALAANRIDSFRGEYAFLSNMYDAPVLYEGIAYKSSEAAFQAQKALDEAVKKTFAQYSGKQAKFHGKRVDLRGDWESVKERVMYEVVKRKFSQNPDLKEKLLATGSKELIEGNTWNDRYWGVCRGVGQNKLGKILMRVREELK